MAKVRERGWWYPYIYLGLLAVVMAVNGIMAYVASSTFDGLVTEHAYEKGNNYNAVLALARQQAKLGWAVDASLAPAASGHKGTISLRFSDKEGKPVDGLTVQAIAQRPTVTGYNITVPFQAGQNGTYTAQVDLPMGGEWDFDLMASGSGTVYQLQRRFVIP
jgi:nitrogen fixation protein FixH